MKMPNDECGAEALRDAQGATGAMRNGRKHTPTKADLQRQLEEAHRDLGQHIASVAYSTLRTRQTLREYPQLERYRGELHAHEMAMVTLRGSLSRMEPEARRSVIAQARRFVPLYNGRHSIPAMKEAA